MKPFARPALFVILLAAILLAACGPTAIPTGLMGAPVEYREEAPAMEPTMGAFFEESAPAAPPDAFAAPEAQGGLDEKSVVPGEAESGGLVTDGNTTLPDIPAQQGDGSMIIKDANVVLEVEDTDVAIDRTTQVVGDLGGYIISSRVWFQDYHGSNYKYATLSMGIPVDEFENAMRRLRALAIRVLDENASGQDVSSEFVDLQSKLGNLEATRDRIRSFLEDAKTVEESLRINQELSNIDDQIEQVKGRMNYLSGRSAFSTITLTLQPQLPTLTPTPTPTPTPTATPTVWNPGATVQNAQKTVTNAYQGIVEMLIWFFVVFVPLLAPPVLIIWLLWKFFTRKGNKPTPSG